jgi:hypothetical protein
MERAAIEKDVSDEALTSESRRAERSAARTPSPSSFALTSFGGQVRERNSNPSRGVRSVPQQELPLPPPSLCRASEDKSGRGAG